MTTTQHHLEPAAAEPEARGPFDALASEPVGPAEPEPAPPAEPTPVGGPAVGVAGRQRRTVRDRFAAHPVAAGAAAVLLVAGAAFGGGFALGYHQAPVGQSAVGDSALVGPPGDGRGPGDGQLPAGPGVQDGTGMMPGDGTLPGDGTGTGGGTTGGGTSGGGVTDGSTT